MQPSPNDFQAVLKDIRGEVQFSAPLHRLTSLQVGGPADVLVSPADVDDLCLLVRQARLAKIPFLVMGGTNVLVRDGGIRGIVIQLSHLKGIHEEPDNRLYAEAGVRMPLLLQYAISHSLSGLEWAAGIPGTVGGGVVMNAGTNLGEMKDVLTAIRMVTLTGKLMTRTATRLTFAYRRSNIPKGVIVGAWIQLAQSTKRTIESVTKQYLRRRKETQPLALPNAGSIFKNPPGLSAGVLIEQAGLKGVHIGDAQISTQHGNFIINTGEARSIDMIRLIQRVRRTVLAHRGIALQLELKIVGEGRQEKTGAEQSATISDLEKEASSVVTKRTMASEKPIVGVLMGGQSAERDISLKTGAAICQALSHLAYRVVPIDVNPSLPRQLRGKKIDVAFLALHGPGGEDGTVQGLLEVMGIPYTGSGVQASAVAMDKELTKILLKANGVVVPKGGVLHGTFSQQNPPFGLKWPVVVKPAAQGSTIGISIVRQPSSWRSALRRARLFGNAIVVESYIPGKEIAVAVVNGKALAPVEIVAPGGFYDFAAKYQKAETQYHCPAPLTPALTTLVKELARKVYAVVGCAGAARVDFRINRRHQPYVLEINTIPGMTERSLLPMAAAQAGLSYEALT